MRKRWRMPKAKPGQLVARYGQEDRYNKPCILYVWGGEGASKSDGRLLMMALEEADIFRGRTLAAELMDRGYDITTLRFSIEKARPPA